MNLLSGHVEEVCKITAQAIFAKLTGKHPCWATFLTFLQIELLQPYQKRNQIQVFSCDFSKFFKTAKQHLLTVTLGISALLAIVIKALRTVELKLRNPKKKKWEREQGLYQKYCIIKRLYKQKFYYFSWYH